MPRKKRAIRRDYLAVGYYEKSGKGSHRKYWHPGIQKHFIVSGHDNDDAERYDEVNLREALRLMEEFKRGQQS